LKLAEKEARLLSLIAQITDLWQFSFNLGMGDTC